jgi:hypothetical protein
MSKPSTSEGNLPTVNYFITIGDEEPGLQMTQDDFDSFLDLGASESCDAPRSEKGENSSSDDDTLSVTLYSDAPSEEFYYRGQKLSPERLHDLFIKALNLAIENALAEYREFNE